MTGVWKEGRIFDFVEHMTRQQRNWTWTWTCTKNSLIDEAMLSAAVAEGVSAKEWRLLLSFVVAALLLSMIVSFEFEESITGVALFAVVVGDRDRDRDRERSSSSNKATFCDDGGCCKSVASDEVDDESAQQSATVLGP